MSRDVYVVLSQCTDGSNDVAVGAVADTLEEACEAVAEDVEEQFCGGEWEGEHPSEPSLDDYIDSVADPASWAASSCGSYWTYEDEDCAMRWEIHKRTVQP